MAVDPAAVYLAYDTNADYDVLESTAKCRLFIPAARRLIAFTSKSGKGGQHVKTEIQYDVAAIQMELRRAIEWLATTGVELDAASNPCYSNSVGATFFDFDSRS